MVLGTGNQLEEKDNEGRQVSKGSWGGVRTDAVEVKSQLGWQ